MRGEVASHENKVGIIFNLIFVMVANILAINLVQYNLRVKNKYKQ